MYNSFMKKFLILIFVLLAIALSIFAFVKKTVVTEYKTKSHPQNKVEVSQSLTTTEKFTLRREFPQETAKTTTKNENEMHQDFSALSNQYQPSQNNNAQLELKKPEISSLEQSVMMCKPYSETMESEFLGLTLDYNIQILGWHNDMCVIEFQANIDGIGNSFKEIYGIEAKDAQISAFAPHIRCEFSKQQIIYVGDNILQENENSRKMLKNPNEINLPQLSEMKEQDARLMKVLMNDKACEITNDDELNKMINNFYGLN